MHTDYMDQMVEDITAHISRRSRARRIDPDTSAAPDLEDVFEALINEDDETGKQVMRKIWKELQETQRVRR